MTRFSVDCKGRLKASGKEFIIVYVTNSTSTIRFKNTFDLYEVPDVVLRDNADDIDQWSENEARNP